MRYSSALVLSTLAVGQAAAANLHNRHASFHERRQAEAKRSPDNNVDWDKVAYDLKDVDWSAINWSSVFASPTATPTAAGASQATPTPDLKKADATPEVKQVPAVSSAAPAPSATGQSTGSTAGSLVSDLLDGVEAIANKVGALVGKNDQSSNGGIWVGTDSAWQASFTNGASQDAVIYCWKADGFSGMIVKDNQPDISVGLKAGEKVNLSFAANVPSACAPVFANTALSNFGGLDQTWWEVTFGPTGAFDVTRNVNMNGNNISAKGSKCTSDMNTCVFKCADSSLSSCETGYNLFNCAASNGGGGGYDPVMGGMGGGCSMGASSETVSITIS